MRALIPLFALTCSVLGSVASAQTVEALAVDETPDLGEIKRDPVAAEQFRFIMSGFQTTLGHGQGGLLTFEIPLIVPYSVVPTSFGISAEAGVGVIGLSANQSDVYALGNGAFTWRATFGRITAGLRLGASFSYEVGVRNRVIATGKHLKNQTNVDRDLIVRHLTAFNLAFRIGGSVHLFAEAQQLVGNGGHYLLSAGLAF